MGEDELIEAWDGRGGAGPDGDEAGNDAEAEFDGGEVGRVFGEGLEGGDDGLECCLICYGYKLVGARAVWI